MNISSFDLALAAAAVVVAGLLYFKIYLPIRRVAQLVQGLVEEKSRGGYVRSGVFGLPEIITGLEEIDHRLESLRASARQEGFGLKTILSSMAEGVIITDRDRVIRLANQAFTRMFRVHGEPVGRRAFDVILHADVHTIMDRAFQGKGETTGEIIIQEMIGVDTSRSVFQLNASALRGEDDEIRGLVLVFHDITRIKQLEDLRREFVANVSHELRTPLAIFHGYLETLLHNPTTPHDEVTRVLQVLKRHSDRLNALVDDLLTLARLESGRIRLECVTVQVRPFLERIRDDWRKTFEQKNCRLELATPIDPPLVELDPLRLEQVIYNLLDNALKYSDPGKTVVFGTLPVTGGETARFFVRDAGVGIPSDKIGNIFQRFYRVDRARSREMGGTGLGLAIVKHIVQLHGGCVAAESEVGKGTTITFDLPRHRPLGSPAGVESASTLG
ncbi:MAG: ATP-binding protein [Candidatus Methylacidiphilales bacterium]|nr:ATP-binding protein [Candidatus Methylacidiphilales bacterium]